MASSDPNGVLGPKSITKPTFFALVINSTDVPEWTQKSIFPLAPGTLGVVEAELPAPVLLTSTLQGEEAVPQVLPALQRDAGFGSLQAYLLALLCDRAVVKLAKAKTRSKSELLQMAELRWTFIDNLSRERIKLWHAHPASLSRWGVYAGLDLGLITEWSLTASSRPGCQPNR